jgi:hypothetical protein
MKFTQRTGETDIISPSLFPFLTKEFSELTPQELESLQKLSQLEQQAKTIAATTRKNLKHLRSHATSAIDYQINSLDLTSREKELIKGLYKETIMTPVTEAMKKLKISNALYSALLSETSADILEGILNFKKGLEENFPITTAMMQILIPAATTLVAIYCPPIGIALAVSEGLIKVAATFFSNENLENTIARMRHDLDNIKKDKELAVAYKTGERINELSTQTNLAPTAISKLGMHLQEAMHATVETAKNIAAERMLRSVCNYADRHLPINLEQIETTFKQIRTDIRKDLKKLGIPDSSIDLSEAILTEAITSAKKEMTQVLNPNAKVFDKIAAIQRSSEIMDKAAEQIGSTVAQGLPNSTEIKKAVTLAVKQEVHKTIRGDITEIAKQLTERSAAKDFAKKALGATLANEITLKRAVQAPQIERRM